MINMAADVEIKFVGFFPGKKVSFFSWLATESD